MKNIIYRKIERLIRIIGTTQNYHEVLMVKLGLKGSCVAKLRSGKLLVLVKDHELSWQTYWREITMYSVMRKLSLRVINNIAIFNFNGYRIVLIFPKEVNYASLFEVFYIEKYNKLNVRNRIVVDIGAYIGDTAIYFTIKGARKVYAVEPYPYTYSILCKNIKLNEGILRGRVKAVNCGIGSKCSYVMLGYRIEDTFTKTIPATNRKIGTKVPINTLESLLKLLDDTEDNEVVLKIDCEGCEYEALLNTNNKILTKFSEIILEFHGTPYPLIRKLKEAGFKMRLFDTEYRLLMFTKN